MILTKYMEIISVLILIFFSITTPVCDANLQSELNQHSSKKWTFMFYDDADFYRAFDPLKWFTEEAYSSENLDVIVLQDKEKRAGRMWHIDEDHNLNLLQKMGELNMGNTSTLQNFIEYCKQYYPAERYIIAFYNHGMGWDGACIDDSNDDFLTMDEMQQAFNATGGVDIVCFTAPCMMGALESAYELNDLTELYIGSEEGSGYVWWGDIIGDICDSLTNTPEQSIEDFGNNTIKLIEENSYEWPQYRPNLTMSAVKTDLLYNIAMIIDSISIDFINNYIELHDDISNAYNNTIKIGYGYGIDIYDFAYECIQIFSNQTIKNKLNSLKENISKAVIAECHGENKEDAHGLSLYFPDPSSSWWNYDISYSFCNLDFTRDTNWDEFLVKYLNISKETSILQILKPTNGFYLNNIKIFTPILIFNPLNKLIIGGIDIIVKAADLDGINHVDFYINNNYRHRDSSYPYQWTWDKKQLFKFRNTIKVIAFDKGANKVESQISVFRIL